MTKQSGDKEPDTGEGSSTSRRIKPIYYSYSPDQVMDLRTKLREVLEFEFLGKAPKRASFTRFLELVQEMLPGEIDLQTLEDSLLHVAGVHMTAEALDAVAWRMAGNHLRLKDRHPCPPWHVQKVHEWVPATCVSCRRQRNSKNNPGAMYGFRIMAGTSAGLFAYRWWSSKFCNFMAKKFGFTVRRGHVPSLLPYSTVEQLVGLRLELLIDPELCGTEPGFETIDVPSAARKYNKELLACRFRTTDEFDCLMGERHENLPCHNCPIGFQRCPAATHRHDWVQKPCVHCKDDTAYFDPDMAGDMCVDCVRKDAQRITK